MNSGGHLLTTKKQKRFEIKRGGGGGGGGGWSRGDRKRVWNREAMLHNFKSRPLIMW